MLYAPPADFRNLLTQLSERWTSDKASIRHLAEQAMHPPAVQPTSLPLSADRTARAWQQFVAGAWQEADMLQVVGQVNKFPVAPQLHALLERQAQQPDAREADFLRLTFDQMEGLSDDQRRIGPA